MMEEATALLNPEQERSRRRPRIALVFVGVAAVGVAALGGGRLAQRQRTTLAATAGSDDGLRVGAAQVDDDGLIVATGGSENGRVRTSTDDDQAAKKHVNPDEADDDDDWKWKVVADDATLNVTVSKTRAPVQWMLGADTSTRTVGMSRAAVSNCVMTTTSPPRSQVSNEYGVNGRVHSAPNYYPYQHIAEPFRTTTLDVIDLPMGSTVRWLFVDTNDDSASVVHLEGASVKRNFTHAGSEVNTTLRVVDGGSYRQRSFLINVKYVRRELRSLNTADRVAFMKAMAMIWTSTDDEEAASKYGKSFITVAHLNRQHLAAFTSTQGCSPTHTWLNFLTAHAVRTETWDS